MAKLSHHGQDVAHFNAGFQAALARRLNDRTIRHGIGERHADLDQVGAGLGHAVQDRHRGSLIGIPCLQERDQRAAAFFPQFGEAGGDAAHGSPRTTGPAGGLPSSA